MKETFEQYLQRLKDRRTEDDYKYTDEDFEKYKDYISDCCKNGMSVYKCLELMYFAERDMDDQLFNREPKQETEVSDFINKLMYRIKVLRTGIENALVLNDINEVKKILSKSLEDVPTTSDGKWQKEQDNTANEILEYILLNDDGVGIALGYNSREMIEQYFKTINYEINQNRK